MKKILLLIAGAIALWLLDGWDEALDAGPDRQNPENDDDRHLWT